MFLKGKIKPFPRRVKGVKEIRAMFEAAGYRRKEEGEPSPEQGEVNSPEKAERESNK